MIGVGVKNSTSDLLIANCDEFIFYDDLVREQKKAVTRRRAAKTGTGKAGTAAKKAAPAAAKSAEAAAVRAPAEGSTPSKDEERREEAIDLIIETVEALVSERGAEEKLWGSMIKQALKRRKPGFNESYYGFRSFNGMLEEGARTGSLELERDEKSGGYRVRLAVHDE